MCAAVGRCVRVSFVLLLPHIEETQSLNRIARECHISISVGRRMEATFKYVRTHACTRYAHPLRIAVF